MASPKLAARALLARLRKQGFTLALAESCTGGLVSHWLTEVPGSSEVYRGGIIAYHNSAKTTFLGVPTGLLRLKGAVSREAAGRMARGVRRAFKSSIGAGITGIAGPSGGTPEKPVGLVYIAVSDRSGTAVRNFRFFGARSSIKRQAARRALALISARLR